jgi:hypothetical protein
MKRTVLSSLVLALLLVPSAAAEANTYDVYSCWAGYGTFRNPNASSAAWTKDQTTAGAHFATGDDCGMNSLSGSMSIVSLSGNFATRGQYAELSLRTPLGTTLAGARLWRRAWTYGSGTAGASQRNHLSVLADGSTVYADSDGGSDAPYGTRGTGDVTAHGIVGANLVTLLAPPASTNLAYRVGCGFDAGCPTVHPSGPAPSYFASGVEMFGAVVSINDTTAPSLAISQTGILDASTVSGIRSFVIQSAADESGIKKLAVFADGSSSPIGVLDFEQDVNRCDWSKAAPCQNVAETEIPVDTRQLADGEHTFVVKAFDAANNEKASTTRYVIVNNTPPAPTGGGPTAGLPNGVTTNPDSAVATPAAGAKLVVTFEPNHKPRLKAKYGRIVDLRGHLVDGNGIAVADAQVGYSALVTTAGARVQKLGSVRTDSSGAFFVSVATRLGSRRLRFTYSPQIGGAVAATAQVQLDVVAPVSFKVGPKHVRNKHSVMFRGTLGAGPIPRKGKLVNLQVVVDGHWHTFATVRSTQSGRFKFRYRFTRTYGRVTYRFRALSRYEAAYPFVAGHSKPVRLRVN